MQALIFLLTLRSGLRAQTPSLLPHPSPPQPESLDRLRRFAASYLERLPSVDCVAVQNPLSQQLVIEFSDIPKEPSVVLGDPELGKNLIEDVFSTFPSTQFKFDHWAMVRHKRVAVYGYSQSAGDGLIYVDESSGAISRLTVQRLAAATYSCSP